MSNIRNQKLIIDVLRAATRAEADTIVENMDRRGLRAEEWADRFVRLMPADGADIAAAVAEAREIIGLRKIADALLTELNARLQVWLRIGAGELPAYGDLFATVTLKWKWELQSTEAEKTAAEYLAGTVRRQGPSPIVQVLLAESAYAAAVVAVDALVEANQFEDTPTWLSKRWVTDRVLRRIKGDGQHAREAAREVVSALETAGCIELSLAWSLLGATPKNQMTWWSTWVGIATMQRQGLLGELSADEAKDVTAAIGVLQLLAEGVYVSEARSLWEILRPMLNEDGEDLPDLPPRELPRERGFSMDVRPRRPGVVVLQHAKSLTSYHSEYKDLVGKEVPLVVARGVEQVRLRLALEYPHALQAVDLLTRDLREGEPVRIAPTMLLGPPGTGKSRLGRRLADLFGMQTYRVDAASASDNMFGGSPRAWSNTTPSVPVRAVAFSRTANVFVAVDEIEKAGTSSHNGNLWNALTPFLERETSSRYRDVSLDATVDLSWVNYVATSNDDTGLPPPLRDRFRIARVPAPTMAHLVPLAANVVSEIEREDGVPGIHGRLEDDELAVIGDFWKRQRFSIRALQRAVRATLEARASFAPRH